MNHNHSVISFLLIFCLFNSLLAENVNHFISSGQLRVENTWQGAEPVSLDLESFSLKADSGVLLHDLSVSLTLLPSSEISSMPSNMVNVTGDFVGAYRLLPNGTHFNTPAVITIPYGPLPIGYRPSDVYTYYYDEDIAQWQQLERVDIDTTLHTISSYTTHFTDFINAIIRVPEMPETSAYVPTFLRDMETPHPLASATIVEMPEANNRGTSEVTYPIEIPQGRAGMTPNLALHYSSAIGNGMLGVGWNLPLQAITIDTRWGVPRYSEDYESEIYTCDGEQLVMNTENPQRKLFYQQAGLPRRQFGSVLFSVRDTKNQNRVVREGNSPKDYRWIVTDINGTKFCYGFYNRDRTVNSSCVLRDNEGNIAYWALAEVIDVHGNSIQYQYDISAGNEIYPRYVYYANNPFHGNEPCYRIDFHYKSRIDAPLDCRLGFMRTTDSVLTYVRVSLVQGDQCVSKRIYCLEYAPETEERCRTDYPTLSLHRIYDMFPHDEREAIEILQCYRSNMSCNGITKFDYYSPSFSTMFGGTEVIVDQDSTSFGWSKLGLSYNRSHTLGGTLGFGFGTQAWQTNLSAGGNYNYTWTHGGTKMQMMDIDGDGLADKVYVRDGSIRIQRQREDENHNVVFLSEEDTGIPAKDLTIDAGHVNTWGLQAGAELDTIINFSINGGQSYTDTYTTTYFADVNGDGMPDYVNDGEVYFNRLHLGLPFLKFDGDSVVRLDSAQCGSFFCEGEAVPELPNCRVVRKELEYYVYHGLGGVSDIPCYKIGEVLEELLRNKEISFYENDVHLTSDCNYNKQIILALQQCDVDLLDMLCADSDNCQVYYCKDCLDHLYDIGVREYIDCCRKRFPTPKEIAFNEWKRGYLKHEKNAQFYEHDNICQAYLLDTICSPSDEPNIESVKVWVAPRSGLVSIKSDIQLIEDSLYARTQSRTADGVRYIVQYNHDVRAEIGNGHHRLSAASASILIDEDISATDYAHRMDTLSSIFVRPGDVFFFRLRSNLTHEFDNVNWIIEITDTLGNRYNSAEDFVLSSSVVIQTDTILSAQFDIDVRCPAGDSALLCVHNGAAIDSITIDSSVSHIVRPISTMPDTAIYLSLSNCSGNLGDIELSSQLHMWSDSRDTMSVWVAPHLSFQPEIIFDSVYYELFGPLYRGWGQFGYNTKSYSDEIPISSLRNFSKEQLTGNNTDFTDAIQHMDTSFFSSEETLTEAFQQANMYTPLQECWLEMKPDPRRYCWESYGNVGRVGRFMVANTRDNSQPTVFGSRYQSLQDSEDNSYTFYDNSVPKLYEGQHPIVVRKHSKTKTWNISAGVGFGYPLPSDNENTIGGGVGFTRSSSTYSLLTDYVDLNGDRYPDIVQSDYVQYTLPWGALDKPKLFPKPQQYMNNSSSKGASLSGSFSHTFRIPGSNARKGTFFSAQAGRSAGRTVSESESVLTYLDINGDGLPDRLSMKQGQVYVAYNLGYSFADEIAMHNLYGIDHNSSTVINGGVNLGGAGEFVNIDKWIEKAGQLVPNTAKGYFQMSLSFGIDASGSNNETSARLVDLNGDGLPEYVEAMNTDSFLVKHNSNHTYNDVSTIWSPKKLQSSLTVNAGSSLAFTAGYTMAFFKITGGINGCPIAYSLTNNFHELIDMNGDGLPDLVWLANNKIHIRYNQMGKQNLLQTITNFNGQKIEIDYALSMPSVEQRGRQWQMSRMDVIAPPVDHVYSADTLRREYDYADPHYDGIERMSLGYGTVITRDIDMDSPSHPTYRQLVRRYNNQDFLEHGKLIYEALTDSAFHRYTEYKIGTLYVDSMGNATDNTCEDMLLRVGTEAHIVSYFEGVMDSVVTAKQYQYDKFHNVIEYHNLGDVLVNDDDLYASIRYDTTIIHHKQNQVSLPRSVFVSNNTTPTYRTETEYDEFGNLVAYDKMDLLSSHVQHFEYKYDHSGLCESIVSPRNYQGDVDYFWINYDDFSHSLPTRVVNHWGGTVQLEYDPYWQKPIRRTDPTEAVMEYEYDLFGRLKRIRSIDNEYWYTNGFDFSYEYTRTPSIVIVPSQHAVSVKKLLYNKIERWDSIYSRTIADTWGRIVCRADVYDAENSHPYYRYYQIAGSDQFCRENKLYVSHFSDTDYLNNMPPPAVPKVYRTFDIADRELRVSRPDSISRVRTYHLGNDAFGVKRLQESTIDENGHVWHVFCSPQQQQTTLICPDSSMTSFRYDALGQLLSVTDPDGLETTYQYDGFGNVLERNHPDAGISVWEYDNIGNVISSATNKQIASAQAVTYEYDYNRLTRIHYPNDSALDVSFRYIGKTGRLYERTDITGHESFHYDILGNITYSTRVVYLPEHNAAFRFSMDFGYNALGQMMGMRYPDGEYVSYRYRNGQLRGISTTRSFGNMRKTDLIDSLCYDADNNVKYVRYGNGAVEEREVNSITSWLSRSYLYTPFNDLHDITYSYDGVGNISMIEQDVDQVSSMGSAYMTEYLYDSQNRLVNANMISDDIGDYSDYSLSYSPSGMMGIKSIQSPSLGLWYGYSKGSNLHRFRNHQLRSVYNIDSNDKLFFAWNQDGQLLATYDSLYDYQRIHIWDEAGQLALFMSRNQAGMYVYDGTGQRTYKLTGTSWQDRYNAGEESWVAEFDDAVLYVSPYLVVTPRGYTKHYYNGTERIASRLGDFGDSPTIDHIIRTEDVRSYQYRYDDHLWSLLYENEFDCTLLNDTIVDIDGEQFSELQETHRGNLPLIYPEAYPVFANMLQDCIDGVPEMESEEESGSVRFYHSDHLGSTSWVTDEVGSPRQYLHYLPYGEPWINQRNTTLTERFTYTGKERDHESGYYYHGARYNNSALGIWLSVDPLVDKYLWITPYAYTLSNPVKYIDPDGREVTIYLSPTDPLKPDAEEYKKKHAEDQTNSLTLFMHGTNEGVCIFDSKRDKYILTGTGFNTLISCILQSKTWNDKRVKDKIIILNACSLGGGRENAAKKASKQLREFLSNEMYDYFTGGDVYVVAPIAPVSNDNEQEKQGWRLYKNGKQLRTKTGVDEMWFRGTPTEKEVKQWIKKCASVVS